MRGLLLLAIALPASVSIGPPTPTIETLRSVASLPAHIAGTFRDIAACHLTPDDDYLVFDRGAHSVWIVPRAGAPREVVQIGVEPGKLLRPLAFDSSADGTFVIADAPYRTERVQVFFYGGGPVGGFTLPGRSTPHVAAGDLVLSGIGSLEFTGRSIVISQPQSGSLISEYGLDGRVIRSFGELRTTGHESERDLHVALNAGQAIAVRQNDGFYFVFLAGVPMFRKYDRDGGFLFERHVEGVELDRHIQGLPQRWPLRKTTEGEFPIVPPTIRTAAVDPSGNLWLSLVTGHTYVYDSSGEKKRTIQFRGAGALSPTNIYFTRDGRILAAPGCYAFDPAR